MEQAAMCASCGQPIRPDDDIAIREGKIYHSRCWKPAVAEKSIPGDGGQAWAGLRLTPRDPEESRNTLGWD